MPTPRVEIRDICKRLPSRGGGELEILRSVSVQIEDGEFVCVVGPSGCGKTTLLRIVDGLIPPSSGVILIDGKQVQGPGPDRGFVFQSDGLFPWRTTQQNVSYGLDVRRMAKSLKASIIQDIINLVGLRGFENHFPHELSGGMRQRVNLARAFAVDPQVLLMDEPFAALDAQTRELLQAELLRIWSERRKTALFITHQLEEAVYLGDRVVVMRSRPGSVREVVSIELPRPRALSVKRTPLFNEYVDHIWAMLQEEVGRSMGAR